MATPETLDFQSLLAPISEEAPTGENLRADRSPSSEYQRLKGLRKEARDAEIRLTKGDTSAVPDWQPLVDGVPAVLTSTSKDLELVTWLLEGLLRTHGFAGLRDGFRLFRELSETFWETLHPEPDEDGHTARVAGLRGLNGDENSKGPLVFAINAVPLTEGQDGDAYAQWHFQQASEVAGISDLDARQRRIDAGAITLEQVDNSVSRTSQDFFRRVASELSECIEEFQVLRALLEAQCGVDQYDRRVAPPTSNIRRALEECQEIVAAYVQEEAPEPEPAEAQEDGAEPKENESGMSRGVQHREDAFRDLEKIARFFRETEPNSVVPWLLERAVHWGRLPAPQLFAELIADESARSEVYKLIGLPSSSAASDSED